MRTEQALIMKVASLRRCAPQEFDAMLAELQGFSDEQMRLCVSASPDQLHRMQGRAQQCAEITTLFKDACKTADRISHKQAHTRDHGQVRVTPGGI